MPMLGTKASLISAIDKQRASGQIISVVDSDAFDDNDDVAMHWIHLGMSRLVYNHPFSIVYDRFLSDRQMSSEMN